MLGPSCDQTDKDILCKAQPRLNEICIVKQPQQSQKSLEQDVLQKHLQIDRSIDRSIFASYGTRAMDYFASLGIFLRRGRRTQR